MLDFKGVIEFADIAVIWFFDLRIFKVDELGVLAIDAGEVGRLQFWIDIRAANDNPSKEDHSSDHSWPQILHTDQFLVIEMLDLHHQLRFLGLSALLRVRICFRLDEVLLIECLDHIIEA